MNTENSCPFHSMLVCSSGWFLSFGFEYVHCIYLEMRYAIVDRAAHSSTSLGCRMLSFNTIDARVGDVPF